jgi:hypothetical protein
MAVPRRKKSFEAKLFEEFDDKKLLEAAKLISTGNLKNVPQLNFIQGLINRKLEKEKTEGHVDIDYMSLLQVGWEACRDDGLMEPLTKALMNKQRMQRGENIESPKNFKELEEVVKRVAEVEGTTQADIKEGAKHFLNGDFDKELEEGEDVEHKADLE